MNPEGHVAQAAMAFCKARREHKVARAALREYRKEHGSCTEGPYETQYESRGECFRGYRDRPAWCAVCQGSQPLWEEYRAAAVRAGVALKRFMRVCALEAEP